MIETNCFVMVTAIFRNFGDLMDYLLKFEFLLYFYILFMNRYRVVYG